MRLLFRHCFPSLISLLIVTGLSICVFGVGQNALAQSTNLTSAKKQSEPLKSPLSVDNVFKALRSKKATVSQKNQILIKAITERGVSFVLTTDIEEQLTELGASQELIEAIRKESAKAQNSSLFYRERADDLRFKKYYAEAIQNYDKAIELDARDKTAYNNRGLALQTLQRYEEALADFTKVIELDPSNRNAYHNRGLVYYNLGQYERAIADYTKAIEIAPRFAESYLRRADAYQMSGQTNLAEADKRRAESLRP
jgi:tetratricopeptide (TPR) repeat protein